jgi:hypothetical protein
MADQILALRSRFVGIPSVSYRAFSRRWAFRPKLMEVSRHKSVDTLRGYVRRADLFRDHAGATFL